MSLDKILITHLFGNKKKCNNFDFLNISSILIRPFGFALGDGLMHLAFAKQLKTIYPNLHLGVLVGRNQDLFATSTLFDELVPYSLFSYIKQRHRWELLLDFRETFNTPDLIADKIIAPKATMIFSKQDKPYYNHNTITNYDFCCPINPNSHVVNHLQSSTFSDYFNLPKVTPELKIHQSDINTALPLWQLDHSHQNTHPESLLKILIAPQGNRQFKKHIPPQELAQLLNKSITSYSNICILIGHTLDSTEYFMKLKRFCNKNLTLHLSPPTSLKEYLNLAASADIIIGVDSGTVHLACALKKPLLSFYARHNINTWHPLPHQNTPHMMVLASYENKDPTTTENFPLDLAIDWLKAQIIKISRSEK